MKKASIISKQEKPDLGKVVAFQPYSFASGL